MPARLEAPQRLPRAGGAPAQVLHRPGAGWEPLLRYGQTTIRDKILYGSGAFLLGRPPAELLAEMRALPLAPAVMEQWLWRNAAALLGIDAVEVERLTSG